LESGDHISWTRIKNYKTRLGITYKEKKAPIDIGKSKDNYNKDRKPRCFNYNIYRHMEKDCWKPKKEKKTRKYWECDKIGHLAKIAGQNRR